MLFCSRSLSSSPSAFAVSGDIAWLLWRRASARRPIIAIGEQAHAGGKGSTGARDVLEQLLADDAGQHVVQVALAGVVQAGGQRFGDIGHRRKFLLTDGKVQETTQRRQQIGNGLSAAR